MGRLIVAILIALAVLVAVILGAAALLPSLISAERFKPQIENALEDTLQRDVTLGGDLKLAVLPSLSLNVADVRIANPPGFSDSPFATMDRMRTQVRWLPLLSGRVVVDAFILERPSLSLEVSETGEANYVFQTGAGGQSQNAQGDTSGQAPAPGDTDINLGDVSFNDVRLVDGTVRYRNAQDGTDLRLSDMTADVVLRSLDQPLRVNGSAIYRDEKVDLTLTADKPRAIITGAPADLTLEVTSDLLVMRGEALMARAPEVNLEGEIYLETPSVRDLLAWTGQALPEGDALQNARLEGSFEATPALITFQTSDLRLDETSGKGRISVDLERATPKLTGDLSLSLMDLRPYLPEESGEPSGGGGPQDPQGGEGAGWPDEPIDAAGLKAVDADLSVVTQGLILPTITFGPSRLEVVLQNGRLTADLQEMDLYQGAGTGSFVFDASGSVPTMELAATVDAVDMLPLLNDMAGFDRLRGIAEANLDLSGRGASPKALVDSLAGTAAFEARDGTFVGINLAEAARGLESLLQGEPRLSSLSTNKETDFTSLSAEVDVDSGVAAVRNLQLTNPLVRVRGGGAINFAEQSVDLVLTPALAERTDAQGAEDFKELATPIRIQGPWGGVRIFPDVQAAATDALRRELNKRLGEEGAAASDLLDALTGGSGAGADAARQSDEERAREAARALGSLLRRSQEDETTDEQEGSDPQSEEDQPGRD